MNLRSQTTKALATTKGLETHGVSNLQLQSQDEKNLSHPSTPQNKQRGPNSADMLPTDLFLTVPDEVLVQIVTHLVAISDLCRLSSVSTRWHSVVESCSDHWRFLFQRAYCTPGIPVSPVQHRAAELATSWKKLYRSRFLAEADVAPWEKPSPFEIQAAIEQMYITDNNNTIQQQKMQENQIPEETCIIFLVDGSGSVTEDDFNSMTSFMLNAADLMKSTKQGRQPIRLGVIQFSNEVKVELFPEPIDKFVSKIENKKDDGGADGGGDGENDDENSAESEDYTPFHSAVESMVRINGGTNIAAAIQKAGQLFKTLSTTTTTTPLDGGGESSKNTTFVVPKNLRKVIALLTDGRIDSFQANEAKEITARLVDEQGYVEVHAFGVGRGVDRMELLRIVRGACPVGEEAANRYLPLMVMEDAPW